LSASVSAIFTAIALYTVTKEMTIATWLAYHKYNKHL